MIIEPSFTIEGHVKWFDPVKGYGFIVPNEESEAKGDVLLHMSVLRAAGFSTIAENAAITCEASRTERGQQATRILQIDESALIAPQEANGLDLALQAECEAETTGDLTPARVKWFDKSKGFGFANLYGDETDIFVHMEVLRRFGLPDLQPGEAILVRAVDGPRGSMAVEVRPWDHSFRS